MGFWQRVSLPRRRFWLFDLEETQLLRRLILFFFSMILESIEPSDAQEHEAVALSLKDQSEQVIENHIGQAEAFVSSIGAKPTPDQLHQAQELNKQSRDLMAAQQEDAQSFIEETAGATSSSPNTEPSKTATQKGSKGCVYKKGGLPSCNKALGQSTNHAVEPHHQEDHDQELPPSKTSPEHFYVFVSLTMPKITLKALAQSAQAHQGVLVIRGLIDNSFIKTGKFIQELGEGVILDPNLFKEYDIKVVPTFVLTSSKGYSRIAGNVTADYALQKLKEGHA